MAAFRRGETACRAGAATPTRGRARSVRRCHRGWVEPHRPSTSRSTWPTHRWRRRIRRPTGHPPPARPEQVQADTCSGVDSAEVVDPAARLNPNTDTSWPVDRSPESPRWGQSTRAPTPDPSTSASEPEAATLRGAASRSPPAATAVPAAQTTSPRRECPHSLSWNGEFAREDPSDTEFEQQSRRVLESDLRVRSADNREQLPERVSHPPVALPRKHHRP